MPPRIFNQIDYTGNLYNTVNKPNGFNNLFGLLGNNSSTQFTNEFINSLGNTYGTEAQEFFMNNPQALQVALDKGLLQIGLDGTGMQTVTDIGLKDQLPNLMKNPTGEYVQGNNFGSFLGKGTDRYGNTTWGGGTALQWLGAGLGAATSLYGMYNANKSMKLAKQNFEEQKALNRANFKMQARSYNNSLRNQMSGRSFTGMSGAAQRMLGRDYNARKAEETY